MAAADISAIRQRYAASPSFSTHSLPLAPLFAGAPRRAPAAAPLAAALAAELRSARGLPALCSLALLLDVHSAHWQPRAAPVLAALSAAVVRAPLAPRGAAAELRLLLRPLLRAAARAGGEGVAALEAAVARLPQHAVEGWYDEGGDSGAAAAGGEPQKKKKRARAEAPAEAAAAAAAAESGGELDEGELDEATAMELLGGLLDEAEELQDDEGVAELRRLIAGVQGGAAAAAPPGEGRPAKKAKRAQKEGAKKALAAAAPKAGAKRG